MEDLPLSIPLSVLTDHTQCPICMLTLTATLTTPCGHRFCTTCIREWVTRKGQCPCCNAFVCTDALIKDHQYDALIAVIVEEKEKASKQYFAKLIQKAEDGDTEMSPIPSTGAIEAVLQKHLLPSLTAHKDYCERMHREYEAQKKKLSANTEEALQRLKDSEDYLGFTQEDLDEKRHEIESAQRDQESVLAKELELCMSLVTQAYDRHLKTSIPPVDLLPVEVTVYVLEKDIRITNVTLKPRDCGRVIWDLITKTMAERGDPITRWDDDVRMLIFGPFAKSSQTQMRETGRTVIEQGTSEREGVMVVKERMRLVLELGVRPGSEVVLYGTIVCRSDLPKQCFSRMSGLDSPTTVDYYTCTDCSLNWICDACRLVCHKGHQTAPFLLNHQPTWACCYCPKKKKCTLIPPV